MTLPADIIGRAAVFSEDRRYRYVWSRSFYMFGAPYCFLMSNPSKADEERGDPTVSRCRNLSEAWGGGAVYVVNRHAYVSTDPNGLFAAADPTGPDNDEAIRRIALYVHLCGGKVIVAWGLPGAATKARREMLLARSAAVVRMLHGLAIPLYALAFSDAGIPRHPRGLPKALQPLPWNPESLNAVA